MSRHQASSIRSIFALLLGIGLVGCTEEQGRYEGITKAEAAEMGGKSDGVDLCEELSWYGDGVCDDFCPLPDPDCGTIADGGAGCQPVGCRMYCEHGFKRDPATGCEICECAGADCGVGYDPCAGLMCGTECSLCPPNDPDCVETAVVKYCQDDGSCGATVPDCSTYDPCAGLICGDQCTLCPPGDPECVETAVLKYCQRDGSCDSTGPDCHF